MVDAVNLLTGIGIGLFVAAPIGPIGITCIRHTLTNGLRAGLLAGMGAATGHAILSGCVGLTASHLFEWTPLLRVVGGLVLLHVGYKVFRSRPTVDSVAMPAGNTWHAAFLGTLLLQLATPASAMLTMLAYINGGSTDEHDESLAWLTWLTAGVFIGSTIWWTVLTAGVSCLQRRMTDNRLHMLNRCSGALILAFGLRLLLAAIIGA
jgi:threonine/homoserine/homoserine lactone efflux protein